MCVSIYMYICTHTYIISYLYMFTSTDAHTHTNMHACRDLITVCHVIPSHSSPRTD